ncbi:MAG: biotin synthase [Burkholderiales bacterium PBB3]|nr:MAG: biotin synthase [Burkholderiales bacterium PBB3]
MPTSRPPTLDATAAARWAALLPSQPMAASPWLHEEVARRMEDRLQWMTLKPATWLHWEPLRGGVQAQALLERRYPNSECFMPEMPMDSAGAASKFIAKPWWSPQRWMGPKRHFRLPDAPVQMLWANMALHMAPDPQALIAQWHSLLASDGFLMFSCLGPDTLGQLRRVYAQQGWPLPSHDFTDMHDWGDMLVGAGFAEPIMDMERITLSYSSPEALLDELRQLGRNLNIHRFAGLRGRGWKARWLEAVRAGLTPPGGDGRLTVTFEVVYGHAFKPKPRLAVAPQTSISLDEMRAALRQPRSGAA